MKLTKKQRLTKGLLFVGEVAELAQVLPSHIAFYTREGLLKVCACTRGGYNLYKRDITLHKLSLIQDFQNKGLSLDEIKVKFNNGLKSQKEDHNEDANDL
ncbi:MAG: MerR family transcriptional regulator [Candidatus Omnitrophica bacterium]|nr:MerR family transcriptional regulator [Candidatus Omnitrophota bacterium]